MRLAAIASMIGAAAAVGPTGSWNMLSQGFGQGAYGLGFFKDAKTGVLAASNNCYQSLDGGNSWNPTPSCGSLGLFQLGGAAAYDTADGDARVAAIAGANVIQFSWNGGANFSSALGSNNAGGLNIQVLYTEAGNAPGGFGIFGPTQDGNTNGVVVSYDGGLTWTALDATAVLGNNTAVNGAAPTSGTWFMIGQQTPGGGGGSTTTTGGTSTGGTSTGGTSTGGTSTGGTTTAAVTGGRKLPRAEFWSRPAALALHEPLTDAGYAGVILKSNNNGKGDWASVYDFTAVGIAPQAIACNDASNCAVVAADSAYAYVYTTTNGGTSWTNTFNITTPGSILTDIRPLGSSAYLAVGGVAFTDAAGNNAYSPIVMQSTDNGASFQNVTTTFSNLNIAATGAFCLPTAAGSPCWLTAIDPNGGAYVAGTV